MKTLLVTGGAGFIGSNFIQHMLSKPQDKAQTQDISIINLDALTYAGNLANLDNIKGDKRYSFVHGDICDQGLVNKLFSEHNIDVVVNFAAESHVDRSILNPEIFAKTNILGTLTLLNSAKHAWQQSDGFRPGVRFVQISTDEVYGSLGKTGLFSEQSPLAPNSPYAASKASADMLVRSYGKTYGMPINITRCSNNFGPYQFPEKLIPRMILCALKDIPLPVYGNGLQIRDWIHVRDHCRAIESVINKAEAGEVFNIGANTERTNLEIVGQILSLLGKSEDLISHVEDRLGHDIRYAIDSSKISDKLGFWPVYTFEQGLKDTVDWYVHNTEWLQTCERSTKQN